MKIQIRLKTPGIKVEDLLGGLEPAIAERDLEVYLNGERCPEVLEDIIAAGLDVLGIEYGDNIELDVGERGDFKRDPEG
jgi:hypothetical protein